jgi:hypothetical protein
MTPFEFLLVLYVILAGLGLTLLVRSIGQIIEARSRIHLYWIHTAWIGFIFIFHVTSWFAFWQFHEYTHWTVIKFLLVVSIPTLLYLVSHISVPEVYGDDRTYDMQAYFYERHRLLMGLLAVTLILVFACEWLLLGVSEWRPNHAVRGIALAAVLLGAFSDRPWVHAVIVFAILAVLLFGLSWLDDPIA